MNISFTGFLKLKDNQNTEHCLNTKQITDTYKKENNETIDIKLTDNSLVSLSGYKYADVCKALIEAEQKGFFELNENKKQTEVKDIIHQKEDKVQKAKNPDILDESKNGSAGKDIFDYISDDIKGTTGGGHFCPNSLNDINTDLRRGESWYINSDYSKRAMKACDDAFEKLPPLEKEEVFYRSVYGIHLSDEILNAKEGDIIIPDNGYAQVLSKQYAAENYLPSESCNPVLFKMICPKGSKVSKTNHRLTGSGSWEEGLMPKGQKFKLIKKDHETIDTPYDLKKTKDITVYTLEYVL